MLNKGADEESLTVGENTYVVDTTNSRINMADFARLIRQDEVLNEEMKNDLLPVGFSPDENTTILDIACGPGGWIREVHHEYPEVKRLVGIDNNRKVIHYARCHKATANAKNVAFELMNIAQPLNFPDNCFDVANARLLVGVVPQQEQWLRLLAECRRIVKPGGYIRLTECEMSWIAGAPVTHRVVDTFLDILWSSRRSYAREQMAIAPMLPAFLKQTALSDVQMRIYAVDWSAGSRWHETISDDLKTSIQVMWEAFLQRMTEEELNELYLEMGREIEREDFKAIWPIVSAQGRKPEA